MYLTLYALYVLNIGFYSSNTQKLEAGDVLFDFTNVTFDISNIIVATATKKLQAFSQFLTVSI